MYIMKKDNHQIEKLFLSYVSHRIRTPLNSVIGFSKLMMNSDMSREQIREFSKRILDSGYDILHYFENLMILSEIESGMIQVNQAEFSLDPFLTGIIGEYNDRFSESEKVFIHREYKPSNSEVLMDTDEYLLKQVVLNCIQLIQNFISEGQILIGYELKGDRVTFNVKSWNCSFKNEINENALKYMEISDYDSQEYLLMKTLKHLLNILNGKLDIDFSHNNQLRFSVTLINNLVKVTA